MAASDGPGETAHSAFMNRRIVTIAVGLFDTAVCGAAAWASIASKSDHATLGLDQAAGALAFPALLAVLFIAAVIAFSR